MENPSKTLLVSKKNKNFNLKIIDQIGESVNLVINDKAYDLTTDDLHIVSEQLKDQLDIMINVEGFNTRNYDPVYISRMLYSFLPYLESVKIDYVNVGDLIVAYDTKSGFTKYVSIKEGRAIKALNGDSSENDDNRGSHHIGQTSKERLDTMFDSVSNNGYPYNNQYIVLYEDQMLIRDGQHRASCIYFAEGNVKIPVVRLYFSRKDISLYETNYCKQFIQNHSLTDLIKIPFRILKKLIDFLAKIVSKIKNRKLETDTELERVYFE